jgi:isopenicillin N synthase-like dioxygenase
MAEVQGTAGLIPVIDISGDAPEAQVADQLVNAATRHGFVYIKNEGKDIPVEAINDMFELVWKYSKESFLSWYYSNVY